MGSLIRPNSRLDKILNTDFCPWANRFVYWLKEPVGWFVVAAAASVLVGLYLSPVGWLLASGLISIIVLGLIWPALVVWTVSCRLRPEVPVTHEGQENALILTVRNRLPIPLWGLAVEGYLVNRLDDMVPNIALACVPALSEADYRLPIRPEFRGLYPQSTPRVTCGFPFGIWIAKRPLQETDPVKVWPRIYGVRGLLPTRGKMRGEEGTGNRAGNIGEFLGVREFRRGDSMRNIHWVQTARQDALVVCEKGAPQQDRITIDVQTCCAANVSVGEAEHLAQRIRIAASISVALHRHGAAVCLEIDGQRHDIPASHRGHEMILDLLAQVPLEGTVITEQKQVRPSEAFAPRMEKIAKRDNRIEIVRPLAPVERGKLGRLPSAIAGQGSGVCEVRWTHSNSTTRGDNRRCQHVVFLDLEKSLEPQLLRLFEEQAYGQHSA